MSHLYYYGPEEQHTFCNTYVLAIELSFTSKLNYYVGRRTVVVHMMDAKRILIVEDEKILAADLEKKLRALGYCVQGIVASGEEAVRLARERPPTLVLMDVRLSGKMDGVEAARQIWENARLPVIYLTAYSDLFLRDPSIMQAPGLCVSKPFLISDLQDVIEIALRNEETPIKQEALSD